jgi:putative flippase GtrA
VRFDLRRWGVFNLVGLGGFVLQLTTVAALTRGFGWPAVLSTAIALELAALQNFLGHSWWTWCDARPRSTRAWLARFGRFQAAKMTSLTASFAAASFFIWCGAPPEVANTAAVLLCAVPNYLLAEHYVFRRVTSTSL